MRALFPCVPRRYKERSRWRRLVQAGLYKGIAGSAGTVEIRQPPLRLITQPSPGRFASPTPHFPAAILPGDQAAAIGVPLPLQPLPCRPPVTATAPTKLCHEPHCCVTRQSVHGHAGKPTTRCKVGGTQVVQDGKLPDRKVGGRRLCCPRRRQDTAHRCAICQAERVAGEQSLSTLRRKRRCLPPLLHPLRSQHTLQPACRA